MILAFAADTRLTVQRLLPLSSEISFEMQQCAVFFLKLNPVVEISSIVSTQCFFSAHQNKSVFPHGDDGDLTLFLSSRCFPPLETSAHSDRDVNINLL